MGCIYKDQGLAPEEVNMLVRGRKVDNLGRSRNFNILSCVRPWNRAFHFSWLSFFLAFLGWFAIVPALEYMVEDPSNNITNDVRKTSNIVSVLGTIFLRLAMGPMLERWGPRRIQSVLLTYGAFMVMLAATVNSAGGLYAVRFCISFVGAAFVPCQFWTSMMFGQEVVGQANAFAGGWGNLGGGFTSVFVAALIAGFQQIADDYTAWRYAMIVPGACMLFVSIPMYFLSDDCPQGHWSKRLYNNAKNKVVDIESDKDMAKKQLLETKKKSLIDDETLGPWIDWRVGTLFVMYAACFGVELAINNSMTSYLYRRFTTDEVINGTNCATDPYDEDGIFVADCSVLGKNLASTVAALFGLQNLYARALGGLFSDRLNRTMHMRGRLIAQFSCLAFEGVMLIVFSRITSLGPAIFFLVMFSIGVQMSEGTTYGIVPFVRTNVGAVAGIVGAGGNVGAVLWSTMFREIDNTSDAYMYLGIIVLVTSLLSFVINVNGTGILYGPNEPLGSGDEEDNSDPGSEATSDDVCKETSFSTAPGSANSGAEPSAVGTV